METTTLYALRFRGALHDLDEERAPEFAPEHVATLTLTHRPYTAADAVAVAQKLAKADLLNRQGVGDAAGLAVARGLYVAERVVKEWDRTDGDGAPLPVSPENIAALHPLWLREFARRVETGLYPTAEELESMKRPTPPSSSPTTNGA